MKERTFTYLHKDHLITATVWNEIESPLVLIDSHNVEDTYPLSLLQEKAEAEGMSFAIVSFLAGMGDNYRMLKKQAERTGYCIVALVGKLKGNRHTDETSVKFQALNHLHWKNVVMALDDKPHMWSHPEKIFPVKVLDLDPTKKAVYKITFY